MKTLYTKRPVTVEVVQWTGENLDECIAFMGGTELSQRERVMTQHLVIRTLEGDMQCAKGDFIIKGVKGEFYPCKPDIFEETYFATGHFKRGDRVAKQEGDYTYEGTVAVVYPKVHSQAERIVVEDDRGLNLIMTAKQLKHV